MARFLKFKFQTILKLNFNGGVNFIKNKTGKDRFQDCCKAKATNALLQS